MDVNKFLSAYLNNQGNIKNRDIKKLVPKLKTIIEEKINNKAIKRGELKNLLHEALKEIGWSENQISKLSQSKTYRDNSQNISAGFQNYKPGGGKVTKFKNGKFFQGGAPGLGKRK
jgi:hypothetical protein